MNSITILDDVRNDMIPENLDKITVPLLLNQRLMIHEIAQRELAGTVENDSNQYPQNVNFIGDPMGSGKTLTILGLHAYNNNVKEVPILRFTKVCLHNKPMNFENSLTKIYPKTIINATMVLVCNATFNHWLNEIKTKTELSVLPMKTIRDLKKFEKEFDRIADGKYDIVLMNNYRTTKKYSLMDKVIDICGGAFWRRFVPDDISTVPIHNCIGLPFALSYVIPFSSIDKDHISFIIKNSGSANLNILEEKFFTVYQKKFEYLTEGLIVKNEPEVVRRAIQIPKINYYEYTLINPDKAALNVLQELGLTREEMIELNNDNLEEIAAQFNVRVKSIFDLAHRILGNLLQETDKCKKIIQKIKKSLDADKEYEDYDFDVEREKVDNLQIPKVDSTFTTEWNEIKDNMSKKIEQNTVKLRNLQENLEYKECQNCGLEFGKETSALMTPCCQYVFCDECILADNKAGQGSKPCLHCGKANTFKQLLLIPFDIIDKIEEVEKNLMDKKEVELKVKEKKEEETPEDLMREGKVSKLELLKHILEKEQSLLEPKEVQYNSPNLLVGADNVPAKNNERQFIIFGAAKHHALAKEITNLGLPATVLHGSQQQMKKIFTSFKSGEIRALVINMRTNFAGFDECSHASDCIFMGNLEDPVKLEQSIARLHRKGKKFNTRVHFIRFDTENHYVSQ